MRFLCVLSLEWSADACILTLSTPVTHSRRGYFMLPLKLGKPALRFTALNPLAVFF